MQRREFLQLAASMGVAAATSTLSTRARASTPYNGPLWLMVNAAGGWDPTYFSDPKGGDINRLYASNQRMTHGPFTFAPLSVSVRRDDAGAMLEIHNNQRFFSTHSSRLRVINGIDTSTNN